MLVLNLAVFASDQPVRGGSLVGPTPRLASCATEAECVDKGRSTTPDNLRLDNLRLRVAR